ncbi:uncharacterized protein BDZ99DRAFT_383332 [Mytilinidion resinicola]|uniref:Distal membrane-arm assembly complex protein 1-like domain-containing protein n=1 Tax=Mytilinidion resinicola TaxID=574789 RepID=A0A6A6YTV4_9PEZI|nr:uncharacterized protein BDZ99DRAFT_383332 [Mytilinidion resinicola]KAF2812386.1 hypothetical protein BDZ99DRAFT_383332 [Mytilinidion resinicola]
MQQPQAASSDQKEYHDCLPCRVMGGGVFVGLGAFTYLNGHSQLRQQQATILKSGSMFGMRSRQAGITGLAATFVGLGIYRLLR